MDSDAQEQVFPGTTGGTVTRHLLALEHLRSGQPDDFWADLIQRAPLEKVDRYLNGQLQHRLPFVKLVVGEYGTGKTFLLRHLEEFCRTQKLPYGVLDVRVNRSGSANVAIVHLLVSLLERLSGMIHLEISAGPSPLLTLWEHADDGRVKGILQGLVDSPFRTNIPSAVEQLFIGGRVSPLRDALLGNYRVSSGTTQNSAMDFLLDVTAACGKAGRPAFLLIDEVEALDAGGVSYRAQMLDALRYLVDHQSRYGGLFLFGTDAFVSLLQSYPALQDRLFALHFSMKSPFWKTSELYEQSHIVFLDHLMSLYQETLSEDERVSLRQIRERVQTALQSGAFPKTTHREFLRHSINIIDAAIEDMGRLDDLLRGFVSSPGPIEPLRGAEEPHLGFAPEAITETVPGSQWETIREATIAEPFMGPPDALEALGAPREYHWLSTSDALVSPVTNPLADLEDDPQEEPWTVGEDAEDTALEMGHALPLHDAPPKAFQNARDDEEIMILPKDYAGGLTAPLEKDLVASSTLAILARRIGKGMDAGDIATDVVFRDAKGDQEAHAGIVARVVRSLDGGRTHKQITEIHLHADWLRKACEPVVKKIHGQGLYRVSFILECLEWYYAFYANETVGSQRAFSLYGWLRANLILWEIVTLASEDMMPLCQRIPAPDHWYQSMSDVANNIMGEHDVNGLAPWKIITARSGVMESIKKTGLFFGEHYKTTPVVLTSTLFR